MGPIVLPVAILPEPGLPGLPAVFFAASLTGSFLADARGESPASFVAFSGVEVFIFTPLLGLKNQILVYSNNESLFDLMILIIVIYIKVAKDSLI
ncbi:MAG: hypothetical protein LBF58_04350 [Deltaproteobacteria bacterium]|nr:hypothetical protein [Deltaproteobacteria bacterium]